MLVALPFSLSFLAGNLASDVWFRLERRFMLASNKKIMERYLALCEQLSDLPDGDPAEEQLYEQLDHIWYDEFTNADREEVDRRIADTPAWAWHEALREED